MPLHSGYYQTGVGKTPEKTPSSLFLTYHPPAVKGLSPLFSQPSVYTGTGGKDIEKNKQACRQKNPVWFTGSSVEEEVLRQEDS
jgi:hypothetical protein